MPAIWQTVHRQLATDQHLSPIDRSGGFVHTRKLSSGTILIKEDDLWLRV